MCSPLSGKPSLGLTYWNAVSVAKYLGRSEWRAIFCHRALTIIDMQGKGVFPGDGKYAVAAYLGQSIQEVD